jgi:hypothetical protein
MLVDAFPESVNIKNGEARFLYAMLIMGAFKHSDCMLFYLPH